LSTASDQNPYHTAEAMNAAVKAALASDSASKNEGLDNSNHIDSSPGGGAEGS